jgi:hypothetical protein
MKISVFKLLCLGLAILGANKLNAQNENKFDFERIEDNSFLLEEAYNQEPGVIQHISSFQYMKDKTWSYNFTDEWPVPGQKHQLSVTVPIMNTGNSGLGDIALNYRYQAVFTNRLAFSPRLSFLLPTGDYKKGLGNGVLGFQLNLPVSFICSHKLVTHYNLGTTIIPSAKDASGIKSDITNINYGGSIIILISETFNFMLEVAGNTTYTKASNSNSVTSNSLFLNPGVRYAINCKSGLQIIPGIAMPIGIGASKGEIGLFAYLSFEHPLWKPQK